MYPAEMEVSPDVDDDRVRECSGASPVCARASSQTNSRRSPLEDDFEEASSVSYATGSKRKRDTVTPPAQKRPASEPGAPSLPQDRHPPHYNWSRDCTPILDESLLSRRKSLSLSCHLAFIPKCLDEQLIVPNLVSTEEPEDLEELVRTRPFGWARALHGMSPLRPLELPSSPHSTTSSRVWETNRPSNYHFTIYEDSQGHATPNASPLQEGFHPQEEDKENIFVSRSDFDSSDDEGDQSHPDLAWSEASTGPRDAFGLPLNREMSDFVPPRNAPFSERPMRQGREVLRTIWVDEAQAPEEDDDWLHDGSLTDTQIREIEDIEASYQRGQLSRARSNRHQALRDDAPVQASTNFHTDVRRVLRFQRHEDRSTTPEDGPVPSQDRLVTREGNEDELQGEDQEQDQ
ncbi:uncharacterized protein N7500_000244 [Penicillium coprophilum]|uniref:uncharacterized protein n=1 Tax=Penicillium coprophilum TaxID=36646 RepID=UPI00238CC9A7|nr:uncharacterized protein N7500_000244 [Penicillium coprophilum]KAJ5177545.1 hypothetical protein N7500_000244 [Penicillium coprophilum]